MKKNNINKIKALEKQGVKFIDNNKDNNINNFNLLDSLSLVEFLL